MKISLGETEIRPTPFFIRLPKRGQHCPYTGYSRSSLTNVCVPTKANNYRPPVPAKCDKKSGNLKGIWLIPFERLIAYVNDLPTPGMATDDRNTAASPIITETREHAIY